MPGTTVGVRRWWPVAAAAAALGLAVLVPLAGGDDPDKPAAAARSSPGAPPGPQPSGPPTAVALRGAAPPAPGTARLVAGPFTDRVTLAGLNVVRGPQAAVTGTLDQLVETGALLVVQVQADFYADDGSLLGTGTTVLRQPGVTAGADDAGAPGTGPGYGGGIAFQVAAAPDYAERVGSALLSVPVLVNE